MTHPLTDEIIEEIAQFEPDLTDPFRLHRAHDMRAGFDLAVERIAEQWEDALQSDLENGASFPNVRAAKELVTKYPRISSFGEILETFRPQQKEKLPADDWQLVHLFERLVEEGSTKGELLAAINQLENDS